VYRWLQARAVIPASVRMRLCEMLSEEELVQLLRGKELLKKYGLLDSEGRFNKAVAFALFDAMMQEETLKEKFQGKMPKMRNVYKKMRKRGSYLHSMFLSMQCVK